jgi:hypothetical protein
MPNCLANELLAFRLNCVRLDVSNAIVWPYTVLANRRPNREGIGPIERWFVFMIPKRPQINFRLDPDQYEKLQKSAAPFGLSVSAYAKSLAMKSRLREPKFSHEDAVAINLALRHLGTNLNQLAYHANAGDLTALQKAQMQEIREAVDAIWQQLS